jgi:hypothetical protein
MRDLLRGLRLVFTQTLGSAFEKVMALGVRVCA